MFRRSVCVRAVSVVAVASLLGGCATNAIRIDRAKTMVAAGRTAGEATTGLMERTRLANREVLISLATIDPNCDVAAPQVMLGATPRGTLFCRPAGPGYGTTDSDRVLRRITKRDFAATMGIIQALSGYLDLVDGVVTREPVDIVAELAAARSDLATIGEAAKAVGLTESSIPALSEAQTTAIDGALKLIADIIHEQEQVDDLRAIETVERKQVFDQTIDKLRAANDSWVTRLGGQLDNQRRVLGVQLRRMGKATEAQRRPIVEQQLTVIEQREALEQVRAGLNEVVDELVRTHNAYRILLFDRNAPMTKSERAKAAKINRDRVMGALKSLTAVVAAF